MALGKRFAMLLRPRARHLGSASQRIAKVAVWQGSAEPGNPTANLGKVAQVTADAKASGAELVLFPELFVSGYDCKGQQLHDAALPQAALREKVGLLSQQTSMCIALPYTELVQNDGSRHLYNSCALFDSSGELVLNYRKVNLWGPWEQKSFFRGGPDQMICADLQFASGLSVRCGALICFDIEFPEPARCLSLQGAELLLVPTALGSGDVDHLTPMQVVPTRALENHVFIMYSNLEGSASSSEEQNVPSFCGRSAIISPDGLELARAEKDGGGVLLTAALELDGFAASVSRNPYLYERFQRIESGYYQVLKETCLLPGVDRELRCMESSTDAQVAEKSSLDSQVTEKERLKHHVEGLDYKEFQYGSEHPSQFLRLYLPSPEHQWLGYDSQTGNAVGYPVLFLIHGGFWKSKWSIENTQSLSLVPDFLERGFAVALVEYRRREMPGGKWPGPELDVTKALEYLQVLSTTEAIDASRVVVLGHSAGGQLALAASNASMLKPCLCVSIASVPDMLPGFEAQLSDEGDAIQQYMGFCPDSEEEKQKYTEASLSSKLPLQCPTLLVSGTEDVDVPPRLLKEFHEKCFGHSGSPVELLEVYGADHYHLVTAGDRRWQEVVRKMTQMLQEICKWQLPPHAEDYGVTERSGFLPSPDPMANCSVDLPPSSDASLFASWEKCVEELPSHLCAGNVRERILSLTVPVVGLEGCLESWQVLLLSDEARAERVFLLLSWMGHAWVWGEETVSHELPSCIAIPWAEVARILGRPPILTYYSFNASNWRRLDPKGEVALGNLCRLNNFLGGQDEEWFSVVHVAIEAAAGKALAAAVRAQQVVVAGHGNHNFQEDLAEALNSLARGIDGMLELLKRMKERCDPYIYYMRVRVFMKGWTADELPDGMTYGGVPGEETRWRQEKFFGETGAQSSVIPALDAAMGLAMSEDELSPYLQAMRSYMPPKHADFIRRLETGPGVRKAILEEVSKQSESPASDRETESRRELVASYNRCVQGLTNFRAVHFELAFTFVRKWDKRKDDEIKGTGGTPFMPYLKKHRESTRSLLIDFPDNSKMEK